MYDSLLETTATTLKLDNNATASTQIWLRFNNVTVDQGATINTASVTLIGDSSANTIDATLAAQNADDAGALSAGEDGTARSWTSESSTWTIPALSAGSSYTSPDIASIIQTVVNRSGWVSGNDILIRISRSASGGKGSQRYFRSGDHGSTPKYAQLDIDYTVAPTAKNDTDTLNASITESGEAITAGLSDTDTLNAGTVESWAFAADVGVTDTDTLNVSISDIPTLILSDTDTLNVSISETNTVDMSAVSLVDTDSLNISITEVFNDPFKITREPFLPENEYTNALTDAQLATLANIDVRAVTAFRASNPHWTLYESGVAAKLCTALGVETQLLRSKMEEARTKILSRHRSSSSPSGLL